MSRRVIMKRLLKDPLVRRIELAFAGFNMAEYGVWVSVLVYAYGHGGVNVAAGVAVAQLIPAGLLAPILARRVDVWGAGPTLRRGYCLQTATLGVTAALLLAAAPPLLVYAGATLAACAVTMTRPAQAALVAEVVGDSAELTGINVLSGWVEGVSVLAGPAVAGALIGLGGTCASIACFGGSMGLAALTLSPITSRNGEHRFAGADDRRCPEPSGGTLASLRRQHGFTELVALLGAQYLVIGMLDVLLVVLAISVLGLGAPGAGYLTASFGAGGVLGSVAAVSLVGRRRLMQPFVAAAILWSVLLVVLGMWPTVLGSFLLLAAAGVTRSVLDVSGRTILLSEAPAELRGRVFGALEGTAMLALSLGSLLVPVLVGVAGARGALIACGGLLSLIVVFVLAPLRSGKQVGAYREPVSGHPSGGMDVTNVAVSSTRPL